MYAHSFATMNNAAISASVADDITRLMTCAIVSIAPLLGGYSTSLERKMCPPVRLRASGSLR